MKRLIAMLLALTLMLALCACGNEGVPYVPPVSGNGGNGGNAGEAPADPDSETTAPTEAEGIVGKWVAEVDLADSLGYTRAEMREMLGEDADDLFWPEDITFKMVYQFDADGGVTAIIDREDALQAWREQIIDNGSAELRNILEDNGMTEEEYEEESGSTLEEYMQINVLDVIEFDDMWTSGELEEDTYELDGNKLYLGDKSDDDYYVIDLDGDVFTIEDTSEDQGEFAFIIDQVFVRQ